MAKESLVQSLGEEWNFSVANIKYYVLKPLVNQASSLGIEVSEDYYKNEDDVKNLDKLAKTLCAAIKKELDNPKFSGQKSTTKLNNPDTKKAEQKTEKKEPLLCKEKPKDIAKQLFDQISGASLNKNTIAILKKIGKNNAAQVIDEYKKFSGQSLADAIDEEWGLDIKTIKDYLCKPLIEQAKSLNLSWCTGLTDKTVEYMFNGDKNPKLELISLHGILGITDKSIEILRNNKGRTETYMNYENYTALFNI